jgi:hypothetical protein
MQVVDGAFRGRRSPRRGEMKGIRCFADQERGLFSKPVSARDFVPLVHDPTI